MSDEVCADRFRELLSSKKLQEIYKKFIETKPKDLGFNFFELVSDIYYRENLHSDILKELLDATSKHGEKDKFFRLFIELLNRVNPKLDIKIEDFSCYLTKREEGRIDISIVSESSKKAIIIENKINGASDMELQLPRYVNYIENKGYSIVAIVYLTLTVSGGPDRYKWSEEDCKKVDEKLVKLVAHQLPEKTCLSSWLGECIDLAEKNDVQIILKHYRELIYHLGKESVNMEEVGNFYNLLLEKQIKPEEIKNIIDKIPEYFIQKIYNDIKDDDIKNKVNVFNIQPVYLGISLICENKTFILSLVAGIKGINVKLWDKDYGTNGIEHVVRLLKEFKDIGHDFGFKEPKDEEDEDMDAYSRFFPVKFSNGYYRSNEEDKFIKEVFDFIKKVILEIDHVNNKEKLQGNEHVSR